MNELEVSVFAEALDDERLLKPEQYEEFKHAMLSVCQDTFILARELAYRSWLTPFQIETILAGEAATLFLGSYVLLEPLGQGGMGKVFRARNWKLNRIVAVKILGDEQVRQPALAARFQREFRALGRIRHPNIVLALDADFQPGAMFYAMEFYEGHDLGEHVAINGPLPVAEACNYIMQAASALQHAHELGLVHRDIKPSNLLLTVPERTVKLLDLGLTRSEMPINDSIFNDLTRAGALIGTPDYMSPEQVIDSRNADIRSDLYSLGCTFYFLLTGMAPFQHVEAIVDKLQAQCEWEATPIEDLRPDLPAEITGVVHRLMMKRRRNRFQTPRDLAIVLQSFKSKPRTESETLLEGRSLTLLEVPRLSPYGQVDRTLALSHSEIEMVPQPAASEEENTPPGQWHFILNRTSGLVSVLIALLAVLMIWQSEAKSKRLTAVPANAPIMQPAAYGPEDDTLLRGEDQVEMGPGMDEPEAN